MRVVTTGTFDCPHMGHATFLKECARLGDLTVGVLSDRFVEGYKGKPVYSEAERAAQIALLGYTVRVCDDQAEFIRQTGPDYVAVGSDWARRDYYTQLGVSVDQFDEWRITLVYIPYTPGISTSDLKRRLGC